MVAVACKVSGLGRRTHYDWMKSDPEYKSEIEAAEEHSIELLEAECRRRAFKGVVKAKYWQGMVCGYDREYSDVLLMFLLKSKRPEKYRDYQQVEHTGKDGAPLTINVQFVKPDGNAADRGESAD